MSLTVWLSFSTMAAQLLVVPRSMPMILLTSVTISWCTRWAEEPNRGLAALPEERRRSGQARVPREQDHSRLPGVHGGVLRGSSCARARRGPLYPRLLRFLRHRDVAEAVGSGAPLQALRPALRSDRHRAGGGGRRAGCGPGGSAQRHLSHPQFVRAHRTGAQAHPLARAEWIGEELAGRGDAARAGGLLTQAGGRALPLQLDLPQRKAGEGIDRLRRQGRGRTAGRDLR